MLITTMAVAMMTANTTTNEPAPVPCALPNPGDSQDVADCKEDACDEYVTNWFVCGLLPVPMREPCRQRYLEEYWNDMDACEAFLEADPYLLAVAMLPDPISSRAASLLR